MSPTIAVHERARMPTAVRSFCQREGRAGTGRRVVCSIAAIGSYLLAFICTAHAFQTNILLSEYALCLRSLWYFDFLVARFWPKAKNEQQNEYEVPLCRRLNLPCGRNPHLLR
jgi:hypothetical protein